MGRRSLTYCALCVAWRKCLAILSLSSVFTNPDSALQWGDRVRPNMSLSFHLSVVSLSTQGQRTLLGISGPPGPVCSARTTSLDLSPHVALTGEAGSSGPWTCTEPCGPRMQGGGLLHPTGRFPSHLPCGSPSILGLFAQSCPQKHLDHEETPQDWSGKAEAGPQGVKVESQCPSASHHAFRAWFVSLVSFFASSANK